MKTTKTKILIKLFLFLIVFAFSLKVFAIWTPPSNSNPTSSNPFPPLNISDTPQQKIGAFAIGQTNHGINFSFISNGSSILEGVLQINPAPPNPETSTYILTVSEGSYMNTWEEISTGNQETQTQSWQVSGNIVSLKNILDNVKIGSTSSIYKRPNNNQPTINKLFLHTIGAHGLATENEEEIYYSIFVGREAGQNTPLEVLGAYANTGLGYQAVHSLLDDDSADEVEFDGDQIADHNTALGYQALYNNTTGSGNTALGSEALKGDNSNMTGYNNTAVGYQVLGSLITGYNNTAVGGKINSYDQATGIATSGLSNTTAIGHNALVSSNKTMVFGQQSLITAWAFGGATVDTSTELIKVGTNSNNGAGARLLKTGVWSSPSDRTLKHEIVDLSYGIDELMKLRPVDFKWNGTNAKDFGFIAQEVKEIIPEVVAGKEGEMGVSYQKINVLLVKAIQEQQEEIKKYRDEFNSLKERLEKLQNE